MIQFFALIPRLPDVSSQEFHDHWRHPHGTMGRLIPTLRSYVQAHQIHTDLLPPEQAEFEGIALSQFDSLKDAVEFGAEPYYTKYIQPDEPNFVDQSRLLWLNTEEEVLVPRATERQGAPYADALWLHLNLPVSTQLLQFVRMGTGSGQAKKTKHLGGASALSGTCATTQTGRPTARTPPFSGQGSYGGRLVRRSRPALRQTARRFPPSSRNQEVRSRSWLSQTASYASFRANVGRSATDPTGPPGPKSPPRSDSVPGSNAVG